MNTINLQQKFGLFDKHWHPHIVAELNNNYVKLAKLEGEFVWHKHDDEDELFVIVEGTLMMDFRDNETVAIKAGEILVVPKGVEHRPWTAQRVFYRAPDQNASATWSDGEGRGGRPRTHRQAKRTGCVCGFG